MLRAAFVAGRPSFAVRVSPPLTRCLSTAPPEPPPSTAVYESNEPRLLRIGCRLLTFKALAVLALGYQSGVQALRNAFDLHKAIEAFGGAEDVILMYGGLASPDFRMPTVCLLYAALSQFVSYRLLNRIVVKLEVEQSPQHVEDTVKLTHLKMFGRKTLSFPRSACTGAQPNSLTTNFVVKSANDWERTYYLLPDEWSSVDKEYLRRLVYEPYFRDEAPPPDETKLLEIEGFGAFRPAQFADPSHPAAKALESGQVSAADLADTPYTIRADGQVVAEFVTPPRLSIAARRKKRSTEKQLPSVPEFKPPPAVVLPEGDSDKDK